MPILGVLGLGIGAIALAVGITALVKVGNAAGEMNDKIERAAALNLEVKKMSDRLDALASQVADMKSGSSTKVDALAKQTQAAVENIGKAINDTRKAVEETRKAIEEVAKRGPAARETPVAQEAAASAGGEQTADQPAVSGDRRIHKIQSGDTFAKLAVKYKVSLDAILKANPDVNPSKLRIGQDVVIP